MINKYLFRFFTLAMILTFSGSVEGMKKKETYKNGRELYNGDIKAISANNKWAIISNAYTRKASFEEKIENIKNGSFYDLEATPFVEVIIWDIEKNKQHAYKQFKGTEITLATVGETKDNFSAILCLKDYDEGEISYTTLVWYLELNVVKIGDRFDKVTACATSSGANCGAISYYNLDEFDDCSKIIYRNQSGLTKIIFPKMTIDALCLTPDGNNLLIPMITTKSFSIRQIISAKQ